MLVNDHPDVRPWYRRHAPELGVAGLYLLLSCVYAWRVIVHFGSEIAGHGGDGWQNLWNMWWFKQALLSGENPFFTPMLHHPSGTTLLFHTLNPFNCALALPFDALFGQPAAYNLVFLFCFAASGFTMYLLVRELTGSRFGAFLAGCVYSFSHFHFAHAQGHLQLNAMEFLPLFLFFLVRLWRTQQIGAGIWMGLSLALVLLCDFYYFVAALFIGLGALIAAALRGPRKLFERRPLVAFSSGVAVFLATGGVLLVAMLATYLGAEIAPAHDARYWSTDLQAFFVPGWVAAYGDLFAPIWSRWTGNSAECSQYLGYTVLGLAALGLVIGGKGRRPWGFLALMLFGMVLSLGPVLHWGGKIHDNVPLPFMLLEKVLPFLKLSGAPVRWHILTLFGSAVLAGYGAAALVAWLGRRWPARPRLVAGLCTLAALLTLAELFPRWVESRPVAQPDFIAELRAVPPGWVFYDLGDPNEALLRQIGHGHRLMGGYIARITKATESFERGSPLLQALRGERRMPAAQLQAEAAALELRYLLVPDNRRGVDALPGFGLQKRWSQWGLSVWEIPWPPPPSPDQGPAS